jgi:uncharacterized protein YkwD
VGRILVLVFVGAALVAGTADARSRDDRAPASVQVAKVSTLEDQVLTAINDLRRSNGLSELRLNAALSLAALGHSQSMAKRGFFSHDGYNGAPFWARIKPRYRPQRGNFWGVGENMVWASPDLSADETIQMWLDSPPHRKNLLTASWREVGLGAVHALGAPGVYQGLDVTILTADFGVR